MMIKIKYSVESGYMIILTMIIVSVLTGTGLAIAATISANYASTKRNTYVDSAVSVAEAGVTDTIARLKTDKAFTGYPDVNGSRKEFYNNATQGRSEYGTIVTTSAGGVAKIVSSGYVYSVQSETDGSKATNKKTVEVSVDVKQVAVTSTTLVGAGGLQMGFNALLPEGDVYVKGKVTLDYSSTIGSNATPVNMNVANAACGTTNWPEVCADEPISIGTFQSGGGAIYGSVCATGQTTSTRIFPGSTGVGLKPGCAAPTITMPTFDKKSFVAKMNPVAVAGNSFPCPTFSGATYTIPANTRITGDLVIGEGFHVGPDRCKILLEGDIFVDGNILVGESGEMRVADSVGTTRPTVVLNGEFKVGILTPTFTPNSSNTPAYVVSFKSTNVACSNSVVVPSLDQQSCLSPAEAKQSADLNGPVTSFKCGFLIGGGSSGRDMSGVIFYSYYSTVLCDIGGVQMRAIGAQGILIGMFGSLTLAGVEDSPFGDILTIPTYKVTSYRQIY